MNITIIMTDNLIPLMYTFLSVVNCGSLNIPTNGGIMTTEGTTYQSTATYSCNLGYTLSRGQTRICQASGDSSGSCNREYMV